MEIMSLPLSEAYWKLLSSERFAYMSIKDAYGKYNHVFSGELQKALNPHNCYFYHEVHHHGSEG